jgi:hypothetical protein
MDEKCHLSWANAGATVRNVSRLPRGCFRPRAAQERPRLFNRGGANALQPH